MVFFCVAHVIGHDTCGCLSSQFSLRPLDFSSTFLFSFRRSCECFGRSVFDGVSTGEKTLSFTVFQASKLE